MFAGMPPTEVLAKGLLPVGNDATDGRGLFKSAPNVLDRSRGYANIYSTYQSRGVIPRQIRS